MEEILIKAGLSKNEAAVYVLLLKSDQSLASDIAKKTDISRPHVYDSMNKLIEKGLVSYVIKNNKRYFSAANPKELLKYLEDEKEKIDAKQEEVKALLPNLLNIQKEQKPKVSVEVYEGKEGIKTVLMDIVNYGQDFVAFGATHKFKKVLPIFSKVFVKRREQKNIQGNIIVREGETPIETKLNHYKWIPKEYSLPTSTIVYGNNTATIIWSETPLGIITKSKEVADSNKSYFKLLWKIGKS
ncbi:MAG: hypothetical protein KJ601_06530 [Nanoarchaeota archaeon]|nr:hypothetical protein [Nanoarchaeota archaeon]MBU1704284.1 hypothetical protein [Nanoarchaeota archaeon]